MLQTYGHFSLLVESFAIGFPGSYRTTTICLAPDLRSQLPDYSTLEGNPLFEALQDNRQTPPDEQAAFRLDFPAWQGTRTERDRRVITKLAMGEGTGRVADMFGLSPARVSQLRSDFKADWNRFCE